MNSQTDCYHDWSYKLEDGRFCTKCSLEETLVADLTPPDPAEDEGFRASESRFNNTGDGLSF